MKLQIRDIDLLPILADKRIATAILMLFVLVTSGIFTYKLATFSSDNEALIRFDEDLNKVIIAQEKRVKMMENEISKDDGRVEVTNNSYSRVSSNPFLILLKKRALSDQSSKVIIQKTPTSKESLFESEEESEGIDKLDIINRIDLLGVLDSRINRGAIIRVKNILVQESGSEYIVKILKVGNEIEGLRLVRLEEDRIIMEKDNEYFTYTLGGGRN